MPAPTLDDALALAKAGFRVLPLMAGTKAPQLKHWPEKASNSPEAVRAYWKYDANIGICTGNGLVVIDVDPAHGGTAPLWLPGPTLSVSTPSGGRHHYYAVDRHVPCSVGRVAPGVDIRGERGQVVAPPSVTDRGEYRWVVEHPIASIDAELLIPADMKQDFAGFRRSFEYRDTVPVGERNAYLASLAGYLYALDHHEVEVLASLQAEADALGFEPSKPGEIAKIARSIARYHS